MSERIALSSYMHAHNLYSSEIWKIPTISPTSTSWKGEKRTTKICSQSAWSEYWNIIDFEILRIEAPTWEPVEHSTIHYTHYTWRKAEKHHHISSMRSSIMMMHVMRKYIFFIPPHSAAISSASAFLSLCEWWRVKRLGRIMKTHTYESAMGRKAYSTLIYPRHHPSFSLPPLTWVQWDFEIYSSSRV